MYEPNDKEASHALKAFNYQRIFVGLRVILYANVAEYLPTSESVGFRITVHDKWNVPFPDAFGYSAPTGFLSSFGVRMVSKKLIFLSTSSKNT